MRLRPASLLSLGVVALAAGALYLTQPWAIKTALYPRAIGIPLLVLAALEFVLSLREQAAPKESQAMDFELSEVVDPKVAMHRTVGIFAWILGFFAAIVLLGFEVAIPLFITAYLKVEAKAPWWLTVVLVVLAWFIFDGLFVRLLHLPFPRGLLFQALD